ncbi:hypothetical protein DITRI_Ditri15bG0136200 [Diplodiscus trichospermus]
MKNLAMITFALVLILATLEADGERLTLEKEREVILCGQASTHKLGRKADVGAKDYKDPAANKGPAATGKTAEENSAVGLVDSLEENVDDEQIHHYYTNGTNPYVLPRPIPPKDSGKRKPPKN